MSDLVTWLRAQLDEDEAHAMKDLHVLDKASNAGDWQAHYGHNLPYSLIMADGQEIARMVAPVGRHDPDAMAVARMVRLARGRAKTMLAEVEAKRRILDDHAAIPGDGINYTQAEQARAEDLIRLLALPYADWDGYDESWRP